MSISKKILDEIANLEEDREMKKLLMKLLEIEDNGNHRNNQLFEKAINDYISKRGGGDNGSKNNKN